MWKSISHWDKILAGTSGSHIIDSEVKWKDQRLIKYNGATWMQDKFSVNMEKFNQCSIHVHAIYAPLCILKKI